MERNHPGITLALRLIITVILMALAVLSSVERFIWWYRWQRARDRRPSWRHHRRVHGA